MSTYKILENVETGRNNIWVNNNIASRKYYHINSAYYREIVIIPFNQTVINYYKTSSTVRLSCTKRYVVITIRAYYYMLFYSRSCCCVIELELLILQIFNTHYFRSMNCLNLRPNYKCV